ncbi:hypothetical protein [Leptospira noguchii]|uniref:hypothetical protein n=1 Tax=Leptospira noguchii TaxID=28182 RepID=UPI000774D790|nr:hypothetical protein [Leptospira noguchii]UOG60280.1 hypothetical protein MAL07_16425 [Leptospira noguchii]
MKKITFYFLPILLLNCFTVYPKEDRVTKTTIENESTYTEDADIYNLTFKLSGEKLIPIVSGWKERKQVTKKNLVDLVETEKTFRLSDKFKILKGSNFGLLQIIVAIPVGIAMLFEFPTLPFRLMSDSTEKRYDKIEYSNSVKIADIKSKNMRFNFKPTDDDEDFLDIDKGEGLNIRKLFEEYGNDYGFGYKLFHKDEEIKLGVFSLNGLSAENPNIQNFVTKLVAEKNRKQKAFCEQNFRKLYNIIDRESMLTGNFIVELACDGAFQNPVQSSMCKEKFSECVPFLSKSEE